jgi:hypothetical protein
VGAVIYGATYQSVYPGISAIANLGSVTLPGILNVDLWLTILLFVLISVTLFYFLERHGELRHGPPLPEPEPETEPTQPVEPAPDLVAAGVVPAGQPAEGETSAE